jgi:hypothetical protein
MLEDAGTIMLPMLFFTFVSKASTADFYRELSSILFLYFISIKRAAA